MSYLEKEMVRTIGNVITCLERKVSKSNFAVVVWEIIDVHKKITIEYFYEKFMILIVQS